MAHDDVWDDSALVASWNEALAEYKKYHSLHATQGNVGGLLAPENQLHAKPETSLDSPAESAPHSGEIVNNANICGQTHFGRAITNDPNTASNLPKRTIVPEEVAEQIRAPRDASDAPSAVPSPEALLGSVQDEGLKKLLMSWYYAGFYTGLYQGQQKQHSQQRQAQ